MPTQRTLAPVQRAYAPIVVFFAALVLLCDLAVVTVHVLNDHTALITGRVHSASVGSAQTHVVPSAGQVFVTGTIDHLSADNAQIPVLKSPLTITAVERGVGHLTIDKALVGGKRVAITWDGGTPLPVSGDGGLDVGAIHADVDGSGITFALDGAARTFEPGTYSLGTSVAVGSAGIATPQDGVKFTADDQTALTSKNNVVVHLDPQKYDLLGPGKVTVTGNLKVQNPDKTETAHSVTLDDGPYRVTVQPGSGAMTVDAILQGQVAVS
jgi:hypothetical protein